MVQLDINSIKRIKQVKTIANARGGRSLNMEVDIKTKSISFIVAERKKIIIDTDDIEKAVEKFNEMEAAGPGENTKLKKDKPVIVASKEKAE